MKRAISSSVEVREEVKHWEKAHSNDRLHSRRWKDFAEGRKLLQAEELRVVSKAESLKSGSWHTAIAEDGGLQRTYSGNPDALTLQA